MTFSKLFTGLAILAVFVVGGAIMLIGQAACRL